MANEWKTFLELLGEDKKWIGQVVSTNSTTKKISVDPVGGGTMVAVDSNGSTYANGVYVYITGNLITGESPTIVYDDVHVV